MDLRDGYQEAQDVFDSVVAQVSPDDWDAPSLCDGWTVRDVVGHVTWGQDMIGGLASGQPSSDASGSPGSASPGDYLAGEPVATWRSARDRASAALTDEALAAPLPEGMLPVPDATVGTFVRILEFDTLAHAWDIAQARGIPIEASDELVARVNETAQQGVHRAPGFFGEQVDAPEGADPLTTLMAFAGRGTGPR